MQIKRVTADDLPSLKPFVDRVVRKNSVTVHPEYFKWQYEADTEKNSGVLALVDDEEVVSISFLQKTSMWFHDKPLTGGWHHEWFTEPKFMGAGLSLIEEQLKRNLFFGQSGITLANANIIQLLRPACWIQATRLFAVLDPRATFELLSQKDPSALQFLKTQTISKAPSVSAGTLVSGFDSNYDKTWIEMRKNFLLATDRTSDYMNWRYVRHPLFQYERMKFTSGAGDAYYVWREEQVDGHDRKIARICDIIGSPQAISETFPAFFQTLKLKPLSFCDFFCTNSEVVSSLLRAGMREAITLKEFDLPRLFSPLATDARKTLSFSYTLPKELVTSDFYDSHRTYFTKGDVNQDRPNF